MNNANDESFLCNSSVAVVKKARALISSAGPKAMQKLKKRMKYCLALLDKNANIFPHPRVGLLVEVQDAVDGEECDDGPVDLPGEVDGGLDVVADVAEHVLERRGQRRGQLVAEREAVRTFRGKT